MALRQTSKDEDGVPLTEYHTTIQQKKEGRAAQPATTNYASTHHATQDKRVVPDVAETRNVCQPAGSADTERGEVQTDGPTNTDKGCDKELDAFFYRVYNYHRRGGMCCIFMEDFCQLFVFAALALICIFFLTCVNYQVLFLKIPVNASVMHKINVFQAIDKDLCFHRLWSTKTWKDATTSFMALWGAFLGFMFIKMVYNVCQYCKIKKFYRKDLEIPDSDLNFMTWHQVQTKILQHYNKMTELDIYHRILRFENYMVAMVNFDLLPLKCCCRPCCKGSCCENCCPTIKQYAYLSRYLMFNLNLILFGVIGKTWHCCGNAPFNKNNRLKNIDGNTENSREKATSKLRCRIAWFVVLHVIFAFFVPVIFVLNFLYMIFQYVGYTGVLKYNPNFLSTKRWSDYSRLYLRHFNELDHELDARLSQGYKPMRDYCDMFSTPVWAIIAWSFRVLFGTVFGVVLVLTLYDGDITNVGYVSAISTGLLVCVAILSAFMPAEVHFLEELFSPIITIFLLCCLSDQADKIVDFLYNNTKKDTNVGDVCSFAMMNITTHGDPKWRFTGSGRTDQPLQPVGTKNGKTEMSLLHFYMNNPKWKPDPEGKEFIKHARCLVRQHAVSLDPSQMNLRNPSNLLPPWTPNQADKNDEFNRDLMNNELNLIVLYLHLNRWQQDTPEEEEAPVTGHNDEATGGCCC